MLVHCGELLRELCWRCLEAEHAITLPHASRIIGPLVGGVGICTSTFSPSLTSTYRRLPTVCLGDGKYMIVVAHVLSLSNITSQVFLGQSVTHTIFDPFRSSQRVPYRPTGGVALVFLFFTLHLNPVKHGKTLRQHVAEFDFPGLVLILAGVVCVLLGFNQSENSCRSKNIRTSFSLTRSCRVLTDDYIAPCCWPRATRYRRSLGIIDLPFPNRSASIIQSEAPQLVLRMKPNNI